MRPPRRVFAALLFCLAVLGAGPRASAADPPTDKPAVEPPVERRLLWNERWPRFRPLELVATGVIGSAAIAEYWLVRPQPRPHWIGGILFDDAIRDSIRLRSPRALHIAWTAADTVDITLTALVVGIDSVVVPLLRGNSDVALELGLMDAESFALSSVLTFTLYDTVGRARPSYVGCQGNPNFDAACLTSPTASFPSGHVNEAFTAAGLSCAHHTMLPIYGSRAADIFACIRDVSLATADGVLRIMGDRHYATDVLAGGGIGFAFGYGIPMLLHYGVGIGARPAAWTIAPLGAGKIGLSVVGTL